MIILQIEHRVPDFNGWKKVFESDPLDRAASGVKSHRVSVVVDKTNYVIIELEFDKLSNAEQMLERLKALWSQVDGKIMISPQTRIIEVVENKIY